MYIDQSTFYWLDQVEHHAIHWFQMQQQQTSVYSDKSIIEFRQKYVCG